MPLHPSLADRQPVPLPEPLPEPVIDAHTHLDACGADTPELVAAAMQRAGSVGVSSVVTIADDLAAAQWAAQATDWHPDLYAAVALHPTRADTLDDHAKRVFTELAGQDKVVAIGETGLDYYWDAAPRDTQVAAFAWHIALAKEVGKPLMIHDREAHEAVLEVLEREGAPNTVIFHCFSGDAAFARRCTDAGYYLSFAGPVSFKNAVALHEAARIAPADRILAETDAPFLTPHPHRGRVNEPAALPYTIRALATLRETELAAMCVTLRENAQRVYALPDN